MNAICDPRTMPICRPGDDLRKKKVRIVRKHEEDDLQEQIIDMFRARQGSDVLCFHVPNGSRMAISQAKRMKRLGLTAGIPDLVFINPLGIAFFMEVKAAKGSLRKEQREFQAHCKGHNIGHAVVRSLEEAEAWMERFGLIRRR